jgi:hypothetical protein
MGRNDATERKTYKALVKRNGDRNWIGHGQGEASHQQNNVKELHDDTSRF